MPLARVRKLTAARRFACWLLLVGWTVAGVAATSGRSTLADQPPTGSVVSTDSPSWRAARLAADAAFREQLLPLAKRCDELGLPREAQLTRDWLIPRDPGRRYIFPPSPADPTQPPANADQVVKFWYAKFREHRAAQAEALLSAARQALAAHEPTAAYQLLHESLRENPEHAEVRRVLALPAAGKLAPQREIRTSAPKADFPRLGWRAGQYWRAESSHFHVASNHSAAEAAELARQLEDVYVVWRQVYFSFWSRDGALAARLAGDDDPLGPSRQHEVVLYRNRDEYIAKLMPSVPQIGLTLGIYLDERRASHLFVDDEAAKPTWWHETAHQLFQETENIRAGVGKESNMWAPEAAAIYFESLRKENGYFTVGGKDADRLQLARYRILRDGFYMPLEELSALGRDALQKHPEIRKLYGQSAALGHLLLDGQQGLYHERFVEFLRKVYSGRADATSLFQRLEQPGAELDRQLREYLDVSDDELAAWPACDRLRNLSLGRTTATAAGIVKLTDPRRLEWLDLSFLKVGHESLAAFRGATKLRQLFLERTSITDAGLEMLVGFRDLEQLDLSHTAITDRGLARLADLKRLQELDLTGCPIGDEGLVHLKRLTKLATLKTTDTRVTPAGLDELRRSLPQLGP